MSIKINSVMQSRVIVSSLTCGIGDGYHYCGVIDDISIGSIPLGQGLDDQPWRTRDRVLVRPNTGNLVMGESQNELLLRTNLHG